MPTPGPSARHNLPWMQYHLLATLEPVTAILGAVNTVIDPNSYLATMTALRQGGPLPYAPPTRFLYEQLSGLWLMFAFQGLVLFRIYDDLRIWRWLCLGMLLSDILNAQGMAEAAGGWNAYLQYSRWELMDWTVFLLTAPALVARLLVIFGVGWRNGGKGKRA